MSRTEKVIFGAIVVGFVGVFGILLSAGFDLWRMTCTHYVQSVNHTRYPDLKAEHQRSYTYRDCVWWFGQQA